MIEKAQRGLLGVSGKKISQDRLSDFECWYYFKNQKL